MLSLAFAFFEGYFEEYLRRSLKGMIMINDSGQTINK
jgi:hypothetical protein